MEASGVYLVSSAPLAAQRTTGTPELLAEIRRLKEESEWMEHLLEDDTERAFTYGENGTMQFGLSSQGGPDGKMFSYEFAYANSLFRPSYGACFYIVEMQRQIMLTRSRAFCSQNPYQHGAIYARKTHVVGKGHSWTAVPRDPEDKPDKKKVSKLQKELDNFYEGTDIYEPIGPYRECQKEKVERESRDGEFIISHGTYGQKKDKCYRPIFIEPLLVWTPESLAEVPPENEILFGVQYRKGDYDLPLKYHIRKLTLLGSTDLGLPTREAGKPLNADEWARGTDAREIQHRKANVDKSWPRGVPDTYWVQERLAQSIRTLHAMGVLVQVRAKVAMITKRVNALEGSVTPLLNAEGAVQITTPSGQTMNALTLPYGTMFNASDQVDYQFPSQNIEVDKIVASIQADLQACAVSLGVADYMMSGNLGHQSYAGSMVASGPVVKTFEDHQQDMIDDDRKVIRRVAMTAIEAGRLDSDTLDVLTVEQHGPTLATSDGVQDAQARQIEHQQRALSLRTWRQMRGYDDARERINFQDEAEDQGALAATQMAAGGLDAGGGGAGGSAAGGQPRERQTPNLRPFSADQEGRQKQRASGATKEEARLREGSYEPHAQETPTQAEVEMASVFISPEWLAQTKSEILALPAGKGSPRDWGGHEAYEPGIMGVRLGTVDGQEAWAVDATAVMIAHDYMDFVCAGNSARYPWIPRDKVLVDWSYSPADAAHDLLHELIEERLMLVGKWSYAFAHKIANWVERTWIVSELRPELAALKPAV